MLSFFAVPWALVGLLALPALLLIYWLRNRFRRVPVSSLMLWVQQRESREGGLHVRRLQTPLLFFLELLAIVLLILAAAGPLWSSSEESRPLMVVLDDSFSMLAGAPDSARSRGREAIAEVLRSGHHGTIRFILAGDHPQLLGNSARTAGEAQVLLDGWRCRAPTANVEESLGLASELGGPRARILVVTDHAPAAVPDPGRIQWRAFGNALPNLAFVSATRTLRDGKERCLLEIANLSSEPRATSLLVQTRAPPTDLYRAALQLRPGETRRIALQLPADTPALDARLDADALEIDNHVVLLPAKKPPVRVAVDLKDSALHTLVEKAVKASGRAVVTATAPELLFTSEENAAGAAWPVQILVDKEAEAYVGPFVLERTHPLTQGLSLEGVVWGAGKTRELAGVPIVLAGNVPLVAVAEAADGRHTLRLRFRPDHSTLQDSPAWPILVWNILQWRAAAQAGLRQVSLRLGEAALLTAPAGVEKIRVTTPDASTREIPVHDGHAIIRGDDVGRYAVQAGDQQYAFAVNALNREESDLTHCASGRWGEWTKPSTGAPVAQSASRLFVLLAALVLTFHWTLVAARSTRSSV
jgi:hypothetical protein